MKQNTSRYKETVNWLYGLQMLGIKVGLDNIKTICSIHGNPQFAYPTVHIAGTNGKGSTAAFLLAMAKKAGLRCGLTTSPHLMEPTERISINNEDISRKDFTRLLCELRESFENYDKDHPEENFSPTFFETIVALAFRYFAEKKVDLAIIETGLGGRLDATNIIIPEVSIITSISVEHTEYLGNTVEEIAAEKAGIIKQGVAVVSAINRAEAQDVLKRTAEKQKAPLRVLGSEFKMEKSNGTLTYIDDAGQIDKLNPNLIGDFQPENAALAVAAARQLQNKGFPLNEGIIRDGVSQAIWPGRLELFEGKPPWLVDCAHNPAAMKALAAHLHEHYSGSKVLAVFGAMKDKDYGIMMATLAPYISDWILTKPQMDRAEDPEKLETLCPSLGKIHHRMKVSSALRFAAEKEKDYDLVLIAGSIFLVGESYRFVQSHHAKD